MNALAPGPDAAGGGWRTVWRHDREGVDIAAGAIALLPGTPPALVVTEEYVFDGLLKCDNTTIYRLSADPDATLGWISFKWPFETPRIDVSTVGGTPAGVVNTRHGVMLLPPTGTEVRWPIDPYTGLDMLGAIDWYALDLVTGRHGDRVVVAAAWNVPLDDSGLHLQAYDLATGVPVAERWRLPEWAGGDWRFPDLWRLGRWNGCPVAATYDGILLHVHCAVTGDLSTQLVLLEPHGDLLVLDDRAGPPLALIGDPIGYPPATPHGTIWCYDLDSGDAYCPPLTGYPGTLTGARLGRWRDGPVAAIVTSTGVSLYALSGQRWTRHLDLGMAVHDVACVAPNQLAIVSAAGPLVLEVTE